MVVILDKRCYCNLLILILMISECSVGILHYEKLSKIGLVKGVTRKYKIKSNPLTKDIVIKMIPNVSNMSQCTGSVMENYKTRLNGILTPIKGALEIYKNNTHDLVGDVRLAGVIMAGVAIGIATAAQITAGVALYEAMKNADNINKLKSSIESTNEAVVKLQETAEKTVYVLTALQDYINTNLVPTIDKISCKQTELSLDLALSKYLSDLLFVFGPNLQDPVSNSMTIQAISQAFGGNYETLLRTLGYATEDFDDLLESDSITGQIIYVDLSSYYIIVRVYFPILTEIQQAYIQELLPVSFNNDNSEWISIVPNFILVRNTLISNIEIGFCLITKRSVICNQDYATPMTNNMRECLTGSTEKCPRELVVSSHVPRFALSNGVLFANCISVTCQCQTTGRAISQSGEQTLLMIDNTTCPTAVLGNVIISLGKYLGSVNYNSEGIAIGPPVFTDKVDISSQISSMNQSLQQSKDYIKEAQRLLDTVNPSLISMLSMIILYVLSIASLCIGLITFISFIIVEKKRNTYSRLEDRRVRPTSSGDLYYIGT
ncbi:fusion protein [Henipavirus nipahense]|uniref:Fusion glycoprotein F0 n=5 Tax=Nipah virus TaxID=3052225 RepID=FUS_NIPAV|nr:fusion protein [Henipavirus nipahense]Q9IH63.1 RecName: Full=Fusion glycoprotein F0; Short=Protein F; Contains: RecName: Full=Fusion glycoprotein F2; Contains: RecName: Full=Fusion glycoprotein F1; Flags: Precursor [Henipavirus nipahense]AAF73956.1 fusion protein [Henipavirus nipahense]AAK29087.1 fusion protein [Henipavirus nipahense]AAK50544.1 fusion protein [Henipavirus nipahense]AAK50553.1 fusion protein [Henipavirus nipahense]APT69633.1 fusion protein [Henipavirus nipahense]